MGYFPPVPQYQGLASATADAMIGARRSGLEMRRQEMGLAAVERETRRKAKLEEVWQAAGGDPDRFEQMGGRSLLNMEEDSQFQGRKLQAQRLQMEERRYEDQTLQTGLERVRKTVADENRLKSEEAKAAAAQAKADADRTATAAYRDRMLALREQAQAQQGVRSIQDRLRYGKQQDETERHNRAMEARPVGGQGVDEVYDSVRGGFVSKRTGAFRPVQGLPPRPVDTKRDYTTERSMRGDFEKLPEVKAYNDLNGAYAKLDSVWGYAQTTGNKAMADQALITLFNKMTDENSVVRESEFVRTSEYLSWENKIKGKIESVSKGGPGITDADREEIRNVGGKMLAAAQGLYEKRASEFRRMASEYGMEPDRIVVRGSRGAKKPSEMSNEELLKALGGD